MGEVFCEPLTDYLERFESLDAVTVCLPTGERRTVEVEGIRVYGRRLALKFRAYNSPEAVKRLGQGVLVVPQEAVFPIPEPDTFYVFEIVGMDVVTEAGEAVGRVADVLSMPGNDVYIVRRRGDEVLIPAVKAHVEVDRAARRIVVRGMELPPLDSAPAGGEEGTRGS